MKKNHYFSSLYGKFLFFFKDKSQHENIEEKFRELVEGIFYEIFFFKLKFDEILFKINLAYGVLSNPEKRRHYDRFGVIDLEGFKKKFNNFYNSQWTKSDQDSNTTNKNKNHQKKTENHQEKTKKPQEETGLATSFFNWLFEIAFSMLLKFIDFFFF